MSIVMSNYVDEMGNPISSVLKGNLVEGILIQVQKLKLDTETTKMTLDKLLEGNQINFEPATTVPALMVFYPILNFAYHMLTTSRTAIGEQRALYQLRLLLRKVDKLLTVYSSSLTLPLQGSGYMLLYVVCFFVFFFF